MTVTAPTVINNILKRYYENRKRNQKKIKKITMRIVNAVRVMN